MPGGGSLSFHEAMTVTEVGRRVLAKGTSTSSGRERSAGGRGSGAVSSSHPSAGGAATGAGVDYQARVTAWAGVHMLAEEDTEAPLGMKGSVARIACETSEPIDDLVVTADVGCGAYVQVKRTVDLSPKDNSALASAVDQFVRQFLDATEAAEGREDPFGAHDRFVLAVGAEAPASIGVVLRETLDRVRAHPGGDLPSNGLGVKRERALTVVAQHVRASWCATTGSGPGDDDVRQLLNLVHVETVEVGEGERDERSAKNILRSSVLESPEQAAKGWSVLINEGLRLIRTRGQADRARLLDVLSSAGVGVRAPRSYREDIQRLRDHSDRVTRLLAEHASIRLGSASVRVQRPCVPLLRAAADTGPVLVVGEPGAGKSGVLYSLFEMLREEGREVIVLAAQQLPVESSGGIRDELRLDHEVVDVLANWSATRSAFLLVDALDAVRTEASGAALRTLIREVSERAKEWNVVVSIREYDARYSPDLPVIFRGNPPDGSMPPLVGAPFTRIRHIVVGRLTDDELRQIGELGAPELAKLLESAPAAVYELLRNPFNLRLAAELLDSGTDPQAIRDVGSQLDLLDLYWQERVLRRGHRSEASSREVVLRRAVDVMSRNRVLNVDRDLVETEVGAGPPIRDLLSEQVIVEWKPRPEDMPRSSSLALAHHVLFDYAVARLLLRRDTHRLVEFLSADRPFVLLGRPSLILHYHYLWTLDHPGGAREEFWETVLAVCASAGIPEIGKLIGPGVAAETGMTIDEFGPLLMSLADPDDSVRTSAENALAYGIRALLAERGSQPEASGLLCDLAERLSATSTIGSVYPTSWILWDLAAHDQLSAAQGQQLGTASRRLLVFAWARRQRDPRLVAWAIRFVCQTFGTDVGASVALLRRAIEPDHLAQHGSEELSMVADAVASLTPHDPGFVRDIYRAAFGYSETSDTPTTIRRGVLSLTSNRRQDYQSALYQLVQSFPAFLRAAPEEAVAAMNVALECHVTRGRPLPDEEAVEFDLDGERARLLADYSHIGDRGQGYPDQYAIQLLDRVQQRLEELADRQADAAKLGVLLDTLVRTCQLAVVWRRLLGSGARYPDQIGMRIRATGWSLPLLMCPDTIGKVGEMIAALFLDLCEADRERIERAILSIPEVTPPDRRGSAEHARDRLLGCLPEDGLVTAEARTRLSALRAADAIPGNEDGVTFQFGTQAVDEVALLAEEGVPVDAEPNRRLRDLERPVKEFAKAHGNTAPESQQSSEALPHMRRLHTALQSSEAAGVHEKQADYAWGSLTEACAAIAKMEDFRCNEEEGAFVRAVLLEAGKHRLPISEGDADESFGYPSWWDPAPRVYAAEGLMASLRQPSCENPDVLAAVKRLSVDSASSVRFKIAIWLLVRYVRDPDWTWRMIERMARDRSLGVLRGLANYPLNRLRFEDPQRVAKITIGIRQAVADAPDRKKLTISCVAILGRLFVWGRDAAASAVIDQLADDPVGHLEEVGHLVREFREVLVTGAVDPPNPDADDARRRSWSFLLRVTREAAAEFRRGVEQKGDTHSVAEDRPTEEQMEGVAHLLDSVGSNIYSISGAHDDDASPGTQVLRRLYSESKEVIDELAEVGLPSLSHHLLQALEVLVPVDPRGVFRRIARVVHGGRKGGYQFDSLAEGVIVRLVDRYLADHRDLFRHDEEAREHLVRVLDTFVQAGSEGARRLSYGLDGIFR